MSRARENADIHDGSTNITTLGTVTAGTISTGATIATGVHGKYTMDEIDHYIYETGTPSTTASQDQINISGGNYLTVTPAATTDIIDFGYMINIHANGNIQQYMGIAIQRATATDFSGTAPNCWATGRHSWGANTVASDEYDQLGGSVMGTASTWGMSAGTTYYLRMVGMTHSVGMTNAMTWGYQNNNDIKQGVEFNYKRWSVV